MGASNTTFAIAICTGLALLSAVAGIGLSFESHQSCSCWPLLNNRSLACVGQCDRRNILLVAEDFTNEVHEMVLANHSQNVVAEPLCLLPNLRKLDLSHNNITIVSANNFTCFPHLNDLSLGYNAITKVDAHAFAELEFLTRLGLEHNLLTWLDPRTFIHPTLVRLQTINLAFNKLLQLDAWVFILPAAFFPNCSLTVNMSNNLVEELVNTVNFSVSQVHDDHPCLHLDLRTNNLRSATHVNVRTVYKMDNCTQLLNLRHVKIDMHQNPFNCDCHMYDLVQCMSPFLEKFKSYPDMYLKNVMCSSPPEASGHVVTSLPDEQFFCETQSDCPAVCKCVWFPANNTVIVTCDGKPLEELPERVPPAANIHLKLRDTKINELQNRYYLNNVSVLDLGRSELMSLKCNLLSWMPSLVSLLLGDNAIRTISPDFNLFNLTHLAHFDLCGNPFKCDCHLIPFHADLVKYSNTTHIRHNAECIRCQDGKPLTEWDQGDLICETRHWSNLRMIIWHGVAGLIGLLIILALAISILKAYRYRMRLRMMWLAYSPIVLPFHSNNTDIVYLRDVGILAHDLDGSYLASLQEVVETFKPPYKIYTSNNLEPNRFELDIMKELMQCKTVLVTITRNFLEDNKCIYCFRALFYHMLQDTSNIRLIPVLTADDKHLFFNSYEDNNIRFFANHFRKIDYIEKKENLMILVKNALPDPIGSEEIDRV